MDSTQSRDEQSIRVSLRPPKPRIFPDGYSGTGPVFFSPDGRITNVGSGKKRKLTLHASARSPTIKAARGPTHQSSNSVQAQRTPEQDATPEAGRRWVVREQLEQRSPQAQYNNSQSCGVDGDTQSGRIRSEMTAQLQEMHRTHGESDEVENVGAYLPQQAGIPTESEQLLQRRVASPHKPTPDANGEDILRPEGTSGRRSVPQSETPIRPALKNLIQDALASDPNGLRSDELVHWLRANRADALLGRDEDKLRASVSATLSTESRKKDATISGHKDDKSTKSGYIWRLVSMGNPNSDDIWVQSPNNGLSRETGYISVIEEADASHPGQREETRASSQQSTGGTTAVLPLHQHSPGFRSNTDDVDLPLPVGETALEPENRNASPSDQEMFYGKLVLQMQELSRRSKQLQGEIGANRADAPNVESLATNAQSMIAKAEELEAAARQARERADDAVRDLQLGQDREKEIAMKEEVVRNMQRDLIEKRAKLDIDDWFC